MTRLIALPLMAVLLAGCDMLVGAAENRAVAELEGAAANLGIAADDLRDAATNLSVNLPVDVASAASFSIDGVTLMEGAKVTGFNLATDPDNLSTVRLSFTAPLGVEQAQAYFVERFAAEKVAVEQAASALTGVTRDGQAFTIRLAPEGSGTSGTVTIDPSR